MTLCLITGKSCCCSNGFALENPDAVITEFENCKYAKELRTYLIKEVIPLLEWASEFKLAGGQNSFRAASEQLRQRLGFPKND